MYYVIGLHEPLGQPVMGRFTTHHSKQLLRYIPAQLTETAPLRCLTPGLYNLLKFCMLISQKLYNIAWLLCKTNRKSYVTYYNSSVPETLNLFTVSGQNAPKPKFSQDKTLPDKRQQNKTPSNRAFIICLHVFPETKWL